MRLQDRPWRADCLTRWLTTVGSEPRRCREVRWFLDGEIPDELQPTRRPVKHTDLYELETLRPWEAHKRRGGSGVMEHKLRVGRAELIELLGVDGYVETWEKWRNGKQRPTGPCLEVRKQVWVTAGLEIGRFEVNGDAGWTICVAADRPLNGSARGLMEAWLPLFESFG